MNSTKRDPVTTAIRKFKRAIEALEAQMQKENIPIARRKGRRQP